MSIAARIVAAAIACLGLGGCWEASAIGAGVQLAFGVAGAVANMDGSPDKGRRIHCYDAWRDLYYAPQDSCVSGDVQITKEEFDQKNAAQERARLAAQQAADTARDLYCHDVMQGSVYKLFARSCHTGDREITHAEYDRHHAAATGSNAQSAGSRYCYDSKFNLVYSVETSHCAGDDKQISKSEFDRRRSAQVAVQTPPDAPSPSLPPQPQAPATKIFYCYDAEADLAYTVKAAECLGADRVVTKAEHDRRVEEKHRALEAQARAAQSGTTASVQPPSQPERIAPIPESLEPVGSGTAFYIDNRGHLLTNAHVVEGCRRVGLLTSDDLVPLQVITTDRKVDLALLRSAELGIAFARFRSHEIMIGEPAYVFGYPLFGALRSINMTNGIVSSVVGPVGNDDLFQTTAAVQPGNSGGPIVDEGGSVIGVIAARFDPSEAQSIGWAIRSEIVAQFAARSGVQLKRQSGVTSVSTTAFARTVSSYTHLVICFN